jgi:hypothetical protein
MSVPTQVRWANLALTQAKKRVGQGGWSILSIDLRHALVCYELVGILASQEHTNGENMRDACDAVMQMSERECS